VKTKSLPLLLLTVLLAGLLVQSELDVGVMHCLDDRTSSPAADLAQPLIVTDTLYDGTVAFPTRADPVRAYDSASGEVIMNVYDTLISMNGSCYWEFVPNLATNVPDRIDVTKSVTSMDVNLADPRGSHWSDGSRCIGWVDSHATSKLDASDVLYMVEPDGSYRTCSVQSFNAGPPVSVTKWRGVYIIWVWPPNELDELEFVSETGDVVDTFDVRDAEYSFKRGLVQDQLNSPMWMLYKPLFDVMNSDPFGSSTTEPTAMSLARLIDYAIEVNETANTLTINVGFPFPDIAFKQILSQTWASIVSKEFSISIGCWNGDLFTDGNGNGFPDWWDSGLVRRKSRSPYDITGAYRYVGTGPYRVTMFNSTSQKIVLEKNSYYWGGWAGKHVNKVELLCMPEWAARRDAFLAGDLDIAAVPEEHSLELVDEKGNLLPGISAYYSHGSTLEAEFFTFTVNPTSTYIGTGHFPDGIPPDFFNNTHVRKAFAYGFDRTQYILEAYMGEAFNHPTPLIYGLTPDYHNESILGYDINFTAAEAELKLAVFNGQRVWDTGFTLSICFNSGNIRRQTAAYMFRDFFGNLSIYNGRAGPPFTVNVVEIDWATFLALLEEFMLPMWMMSWVGDFPDPDNFFVPFMHSYGDFAYFQNYAADNGWGKRKDELIDLALRTPDGPARAALYSELEQIYINDVPSIPLAQPITGRWERKCVKETRACIPPNIFPRGYYYYDLYKEEPPLKIEIKVAVHSVKDSDTTKKEFSDWIATANKIYGCSLKFVIDKYEIVNSFDPEKQSTAGAVNIYSVKERPNAKEPDKFVSATYLAAGYIMMTPGDGKNIKVKPTTLAHELGHWCGLAQGAEGTAEGHNPDPKNIEHADVDNDGGTKPYSSCHRAGENVTDGQQQKVRDYATNKWLNGKLEAKYGFDVMRDVNAPFIDLTGAEVWLESGNTTTLHLTLTVASFLSSDCELGFFIESDNNALSGEPHEGIDYYVGFNPSTNQTIFRRYDQNWTSLDPSGVTYEFAYNYPDLNVPAEMVGVTLDIPVEMLERGGRGTLSVRATGTYQNMTDKTPDTGFITYTVVTLLGDINRDGTVDIYDAILLANAYNSKPGDPNWNVAADINGDNVIDIYDAIMLANNYGKTA